MTDRPDGARLLDAARAVLRERLLEELPDGLRYDARLVANAMAIAAREIDAGDTDRRATYAALAALFGETPAHEGRGESLGEGIERLGWRLASEIRGAKRDADDEVHALLRADARARLRLVNPRAAATED